MDPSNLHFISLISPSRGGQTTPLPPGIGGALSPMVIPLATRADDAISSAYGGGQHTISMIPTTAGPMMLTQPHALPPDLPVSAPAAVQPQVPSVNLYKCVTGASSDEVPREASQRNKKKASLDMLQKAYTDLNSRKIKDPLSSFLPDIPGEFDSSESPETMLLDLVEHKPIGGKEFLPLSGQALLGFRLLPGPLPEQLRIDPPSMAEHSKSRKKRKHKHRNINRSEDKSDIYPAAPRPAKLPSDAYSFIKHEPPPGSFPMTAAPEAVLHGGGPSQILPQPAFSIAGPVAHGVGATQQVLGDKKKKKKRDRDKKKKEKKKKKHHTQEPHGHSSHSLPHSHPTPPPPPPSSTSHFSHTHS